MNGKYTARLFTRWNEVIPPYLTDSEIKELNNGLTEICDFFGGLRTESSATVYWNMKRESIQRNIEARKMKTENL